MDLGLDLETDELMIALHHVGPAMKIAQSVLFFYIVKIALRHYILVYRTGEPHEKTIDDWNVGNISLVCGCI